MVTDEIKKEFQEKILLKMPVMFYKAEFKSRIVAGSSQQQKSRYTLRDIKHGNSSAQSQPFYKPLTKPHAKFK